MFVEYLAEAELFDYVISAYFLILDT